MMMHAFNFSTWEAEFKVSLNYIVSPWPTRAIKCDLVSKKK